MNRILIAAIGAIAAFTTATASEPDPSSEAFDFHYDIAPILAKQGCAAAECHGGATGRGGFKLSLFATDAQWDYHAITQDMDGRRIDYPEPSNSLFLKKPSRQVKHGGGRILDQDDEAFRTLMNWIRMGAPFQAGPEKTLTGLSMEKSGTNSVRAWAAFETPDGVQRVDVTSQTVLTSSNSEIVEVEEDGGYHLKDPGKAWIFGRYANQSARFRVAHPFPMEDSRTHPAASTSMDHPLDRVWTSQLKELGLSPAGFASDFTLLRRLYLQLVNRPPSLFEIQEYLEMPESTRLADTARRLTAGEEFANAFSLYLREWLEIPNPAQDERHTQSRNESLRNRVLAMVRQERSLDSLVEKFLDEHQDELLMARYSDPRDRAEFVGRGFLGIRIGCARCHNHPLDRWRQTEHLQFSAFFANPRPAESGAMMQGKFFLPGSGEAVQPRLLPVSNAAPHPDMAPREQLAWFLLEASREQFARNFANRLFTVLLGAPLVGPENDHRPTNPATHEPLLEALTDLLVKLDFDYREWIVQVVSTRLYALASQSPNEDESIDGFHLIKYFAARSTQPLPAHTFIRSIESALGVPIQSGRPPETPLARQLYVLNSGLIQDALKAEGNQVDLLFEFPMPNEQRLRELFLLILSRPPNDAERESFLPALENSPDPLKTGRSLAFALISSRECGFIR